jgi:hypothetical protein
MNKIVFIIIVILVLIILLYSASNKESFDNLGVGPYPVSVSSVLLEDVYPIKSKSGVSGNSNNNSWKNYPIYEVGSYEQITNNIKYPNNPDDGKCTPADLCGILYKDYQEQSNVSKVLPPSNNECGLRVNYYNTSQNMFAYKQDNTNILY